MSWLAIGLVGTKGSGKGTIAALFTAFARKKGRSVIRIGFSDALRELCVIAGVEPTVANLQGIAQDFEKRFGAGTVANMAKARAEREGADIKIFDGLRWWPDYEMLRSCAPNVLIFTTADAGLRWERSRKRNQRPGDALKSLEQFMEEEKAENEIYIPQIGAKADYIIENNSGIELTEQSLQELRHITAPMFEEMLAKL